MTFDLEVLQLPAPLDHRLDLRFDFADVESGHGELLLDGPTDLHGLLGAREGEGALLQETFYLFPSTLLIPAHTHLHQDLNGTGILQTTFSSYHLAFHTKSLYLNLKIQF